MSETVFMKREAVLLNLLCVVAALVFLALALLNALYSVSFLTTDNLFVTLICMVMALLFAVNPLLYLNDQGRLPIPFQKKKALAVSAPNAGGRTLPPSAPLLDAKGRAVPPDVRSMVANMKPKDPQ
jgi:hypothetical protein